MGIERFLKPEKSKVEVHASNQSAKAFRSQVKVLDFDVGRLRIAVKSQFCKLAGTTAKHKSEMAQVKLLNLE